ncbi:FecCD family ABC transporter permease [Chitinimonas koreensis]|uniref:FecCD family ABC transporter permease n=1 Tax=Chitinimonas koreensis TaxID=356302 RepID=UPI000420EAA0|nr:iron ABC transporter permease [Chitinimonas koreensis]QNM97310.1 iron ABC transporter permease [Chitinimonas koreensis]
MPALPLSARHLSNALWFGLLALGLLAALAATRGAVEVPFWRVPGLLMAEPAGETERMWRSVLIDVRLPRIVLALAVGGALAVAGCALQAVFRNPLAEPGLIGASSGAALAAALVLAVFPGFAPAPAAFVGALAATWLAWLIGRGHDAARLLLAGIALNALAGAGLTLLNYLADDDALRGTLLWAMGSLADAGWPTLGWLLPMLALCGGLLWREARALDALLLGEREAFHLGYALTSLRRRLVALTALTVALTVAACGALAFVGLIAPHLARLLLGPSHRALLPGAALIGAACMLLADTLARTAVLPAELPIGALLSAVGAPFFLALLVRKR